MYKCCWNIQKTVGRMQAQLLLLSSILPYEAPKVRRVVFCFCNLNRSSNFQPLSVETVYGGPAISKRTAGVQGLVHTRGWRWS